MDRKTTSDLTAAGNTPGVRGNAEELEISNWKSSTGNCWRGAWTLPLLAFAFATSAPIAIAQQQQQGVCARVKIEILQELTLERIGFLATLEVTDNDATEPITDFFADLTFEDPERIVDGVPYDASNLFFVRKPELENINTIDGTGIIGPTKKAIVRWFIIPKIAAGGTNATGIFYSVGARLSGKFKGVDVPEDVLLVNPDTIQVRPEPQLEITYFQPRDVQGDDPFTDQVESPIPFTLGVIVKNGGFGMARKLKIDSQQPRIVENKNGLLLIARLLGARVQDSALQNASLLVNLGDIPPGEARKGAWDMITSLSGEFIEFKASYTHASDLGGEDTSVIKSLNAHFIAHEVLNDQPGRDAILDFLADTDRDDAHIPDALYENNGNVLPVNHLTGATVEGGGATFQVNLASDREGWGYIRLDDPGQARLKIASITRSDGKTINRNNYWTNVRYTKLGNVRQSFFNLLDLVGLGDYSYTVTYETSNDDSQPPVTRIQFADSVVEAGGKVFLQPETQVFFISDDASPVSIVYNVNGGAFLPAIPFRLREPGEYVIQYYATDSSNNRELTKTATLVISGEGPSLASATIASQPIFVSGDALSIRPSEATLSFQAQASPTQVDAEVDVFRGVIGFATVSGAPSSPTSDRTATLTVAGDHVDFYRYQLDGNRWSTEAPVSTAIALQDLANGKHSLLVVGRSRHGAYVDLTNPDAVNINTASAAVLMTLPGLDESIVQAIIAMRAGVDGVLGTADDILFENTGGLANIPGLTPETLSTIRSLVTTASPASAVKVDWTVNSSAPATRITGAPPTPSRSLTATLNAGGAGVTDYRWTINNGFYRAEAPVATPFTISDLKAGDQTVAVIGKINGTWQDMNNATTVRWLLDPAYGSDLSRLTKVRSATMPNIGAALTRFTWDGKNSTGIVQPPGWYTIRVTIRDALGRSYFTTKLVEIGELTGGFATIADETRGPKNPHARGRWAVWQDQSTQNWRVFATDMLGNSGPVDISGGTASQENPRTDGRYVVWQARQANGNWDLFLCDLASASPAPTPVTRTHGTDEVNPAVEWPWVVYQARSSTAPDAPWQLVARNLVTSQVTDVAPGSQDQLDPSIQAGRVVWQDHRDVGFGEIYMKDLETGDVRRLTTNGFGQYHPAIWGNWVVWQDNRNGTVDIYGFDLLRNAEFRITNTPENEARPFLDGPWLVCEEDSLGVLGANLRLIHLASFRTVSLTRSASMKTRPALAGGRVVWQEAEGNLTRIMSAGLPAVQAVFENQNAVAITESMASFQQNAFSLLSLWSAQAGVQEITAYTALVPEVVTKTARIVNAQPQGDNFPLTPGSFVWVKFGDSRVLDLGPGGTGVVNLGAGVNVLSYTQFPSAYSAFQLLNQLGPANVRAVRMLDSSSGRWLVAESSTGAAIGYDFAIPNVAVLLIDMASPVNQWRPQ